MDSDTYFNDDQNGFVQLHEIYRGDSLAHLLHAKCTIVIHFCVVDGFYFAIGCGCMSVVSC